MLRLNRLLTTMMSGTTMTSMNPSMNPAMQAPMMEPRPPRMAATKAFHPKVTPM